MYMHCSSTGARGTEQGYKSKWAFKGQWSASGSVTASDKSMDDSLGNCGRSALSCCMLLLLLLCARSNIIPSDWPVLVLQLVRHFRSRGPLCGSISSSTADKS